MKFIQHQTDGPIALVTLARPKANALNLAMVREIASALGDASADAGVHAIVLSSAIPKFFSAGFDVNEVFEYSREEMARFLSSYGELVHQLHHFPKPTVAALPGHTFAGGAILALACDFRAMAEGEFGFALNEINVGVTLPVGIFKLLADVVGAGHARRMFLTGDPVPPARAVEIGLIDELAPAADMTSRAMSLARVLAQKQPAVYRAIKAVIREATGHPASGGGLALAPPVDPWFTPEAEERKRTMRAAVKK
jgi:enoyl-CoA hydratase/carnithine racemase